MRIRFTQVGAHGDSGEHFSMTAVVRVHSDEEAEIAGQTFARLCERLMEGALAYQRVIYGTSEEPES